MSVCPRKGKQLCEPAVGGATVRGRLLRAVPLDKPFLLSTLRVVATLVSNNSITDIDNVPGGPKNLNP